jgi:hypothetical protein
MSVEDYQAVDEGSEWWSQSSEISEKYKAAAKKAGAGIKRTQKDEKKAKRYDFLLAKFLVEMILKKKYDTLLGGLFSCLDAGYGTNFLLWILSLIYLPISHEIRWASGKTPVVFEYIPSNEELQFDDHDLAPEVRDRVNAWIEDMEAVVTLEVSSIITKRTLWLILYDDKVRDFTSDVFAFFFLELNISITQVKAKSYSEFILWELEKSLKKNMPELQGKWEAEGLEI